MALVKEWEKELAMLAPTVQVGRVDKGENDMRS
jgi:hypothetical protein